MFFKKKKTMFQDDKDFTTDNNNELNEEMLHGLNTDDSMSGDQLLNDGALENERAGQELEEAKDKYLRLAAEFENYKRRTNKEQWELRQTAGRDIITSMLEVLDDSERAAKQLESTDDLDAIRDGISLVFNKLRTTLQQKGLKPMESKGADFDPELHEAIAELPMGDDMQGKVVDVVMPGYYLNDKLIRHAKVVVGK